MPNMYNAVCKACGGETRVDLDKVHGITHCEYCDTVITLPKSDCSPETIDLLRHGEMLLYTCEFDKAYNIFKRVTNKAANESEAYFGMALAAFRVQYLFDRVNRREQPICYDISEQLFSSDDNCKKAIALALGAQKAEYLRRAAEIDSIRSKFYLLKNSGEKYDCFICVKVSDETGRMTDDAATAMRLHRELEKRGYKPFYSEFDIHDRVGADYESLILYALYTSKCMIVICSKEEYLRTDWVQNEYTRFLRMIGRKDKAADALAIAYSGTVIERLPGSEKKYQGVDLKKPDAFSLLNDFVGRHVSPEKPTKKYCSACGTENSATAKFCNNCGKTEFLESYEQHIQIKTERELRQKLEAEYNAKLEAELKSRPQEQPKTQIAPPPQAIIQSDESYPTFNNYDKSEFEIDGTELIKYKGKAQTAKIPSSVTSIGDRAFSYCSGLTNIEIPNSVTSIGEEAFLDCSGLTKITVQRGNKKYHSDGNCLIETESKTLITGCKISIIPIDGSVTSIGDYAFRSCSELTSITIPDSVTSIGDYAFYNCSGLTSITIPNSVTSIRRGAFRDCSGLTSITIPDSVTSIEDYAFSHCSGLTSIKYKSTKEQWEKIKKVYGWDYKVPETCSVILSDGTEIKL